MLIFVGNLAWETSVSELLELVSRYGRVRHVEVPIHPRTKQPMGIGIVRFHDRADARHAMKELDSYPLRGRLLRVFVRRRRHGGATK